MRWILEAVDAVFALHQRPAFVSFLQFYGVTGDDYAAAELVYGELVGNAIRHAGGVVSIAVDWSAPAPTLAVSDSGRGFEFRGAHISGPDEECGRGLFIVSQLCEALTVERLVEGGCRVTATLPIGRAESGCFGGEYRRFEQSEAVPEGILPARRSVRSS